MLTAGIFAVAAGGESARAREQQRRRRRRALHRKLPVHDGRRQFVLHRRGPGDHLDRLLAADGWLEEEKELVALRDYPDPDAVDHVVFGQVS